MHLAKAGEAIQVWNSWGSMTPELSASAAVKQASAECDGWEEWEEWEEWEAWEE